MKNEYDIVIVGGGPVGASLANCLSGSGYRIAVLEKSPINSGQQPSYDDRGLALSLSSCRILNAAGVWEEVNDTCTPIKKIHVSDRGNFGIVRLDASDMGLDAMGYVVVARNLGQALVRRLQTESEIEYLCPAEVTGLSQDEDKVILQTVTNGASREISSHLVIGADGSNSRIRGLAGLSAKIKDYKQTAIVANISTDGCTGDTAYERFTPDGPLALLPLGKSTYVSIFCARTEAAVKNMDMNDDAFIATLQDVAGSRHGRITRLGTRGAYPLKLIKTDPQYARRIVMLGNSAHTIHPNGAQGFNLGLRDAAYFAELLITNRRTPGFDPGSSQLFEAYSRFRTQDQRRVVGFSDGLAGVFYSENLVKKTFRNTAMSLFNTLPSMKKKFAMMAMGLDGRQPSLARGLQLDQL